MHLQRQQRQPQRSHVVEEEGVVRARHRRVQVGVGADDARRLAAQLQRDRHLRA
jgi:hypothetical protein